MNSFASKLLLNIFATPAGSTAGAPAASTSPTMRALSELEAKAVAGGPQIINEPGV